MAKIHEEIVVIKLSKLINENGDSAGTVATSELCEALQAVAEELAGVGIVVEVERA